jgi:hypothetical protein
MASYRIRQRTFLRLTGHDWLQIMGIWLIATALIAGMTFTQIHHDRQQAQQLQRREQLRDMMT